MRIAEFFLPLRQGKSTYVRIVNPEGKGIPLITLHGGPGSTHNSLELIDPLASLGDRPVVFYDQFGCGLSSISKNPEGYSAEDWVDELDCLIKHLGYKEFFLLGHSWGGMLLQLYLQAKGQKGVKGIVLSSTLCSASLWKEETHRLIKKLSENDQKAIEDAESNGNYTSKEFKEATERYMKMTVYDIPSDDTVPECLRRKKNSGTISYLSAWGESEFAPTGSLKAYDTRPFLPEIKCPSLVLYGSEDESTKLQNETIFALLGSKNKKIHCFEGSRHMTYWECGDSYLEIVSAFLNSIEK